MKIIGNTVGTTLNPKKIPEIVDTANAIKGNASGAVISISDVSPLKHALKVKMEAASGVELPKLKVTGKNIFDPSILLGISSASMTDGVIEIPYTSSGHVENAVRIYAGGFVTLSFKRKNSNGSGASGLRFGAVYKDGTKFEVIAYAASSDYEEFVWTSAKEVEYITTISGGDNPTWIKDIQLEFGGEITPYEPYSEVEYTPNADGTVVGVKSIYPVMNLKTDTAGVTIEAEYNRDLNKAFNELLQRVAAIPVAAVDE